MHLLNWKLVIMLRPNSSRNKFLFYLNIIFIHCVTKYSIAWSSSTISITNIRLSPCKVENIKESNWRSNKHERTWNEKRNLLKSAFICRSSCVCFWFCPVIIRWVERKVDRFPDQVKPFYCFEISLQCDKHPTELNYFKFNVKFILNCFQRHTFSGPLIRIRLTET